MSKWKKFKEAVKNPPPERLASIEYKSHALNILGLLIVSLILIVKGFWYIIFAFIFGVGVSYSQMMGAYQRYKMLQKFNPLNLPPIEKDPSPSRRRQRIIQQVFGRFTGWFAAFIIAVVIYVLIFPKDFLGFLLFFGAFLIPWLLVYFFLIFWIANHFYKTERRKSNEKTE